MNCILYCFITVYVSSITFSGSSRLSEISLIASALLGFLTVAYVRNPFLANRSDVSNPIPLALPVTTAIFCSGVFYLSASCYYSSMYCHSFISGVSIWLCDQKNTLRRQKTYNKWYICVYLSCQIIFYHMAL
jgi:hypothetical protein